MNYPCIDCGKARTIKSKNRLRCKSCSKKGIFNPQFKKKSWNRGIYKSKKISYSGVHMWMKRTFGLANTCEICHTRTSPKYEWANRSGNYLMERNDWLMLCAKCHHKFDNISQKMWATRRLFK